MNNSLFGKRILVLVPPIHPLDTQIVSQLQDMGANVMWIQDKLFSFNPISRVGNFNCLRKLWYKVRRFNIKYHSQYMDAYEQSWDYFLCFNGFSLPSDLVEYLRLKNSSMKACLYLWDSMNLFRFEKNKDKFDYVFTFDPEDSKKYGISYLPLFWVSAEANSLPIEKCQYDICFIGKLHSDRFQVVRKIEDICKKENLKSFFKIVITDKGSRCIELLKHLFATRLLLRKESDFRYDLISGKIQDPIVTFDYLDYSRVEKVIADSKTVLDIHVPNQSGYSNRMIQSLSQGKKVITTNTYIYTDNFLKDVENVMVIDRNNPQLSTESFNNFIGKECKDSKSLQELRIDKWLLKIIG